MAVKSFIVQALESVTCSHGLLEFDNVKNKIKQMMPKIHLK